MGTELEIKLRGEPAQLDARQVISQLGNVLKLVGLLEDGLLKTPRRDADRSSWGFTSLELASVSARCAPIEPRGGADWEHISRATLALVDGFAKAGAEKVLPAGWGEEAATLGAKTAEHLGLTADRAMVLNVYEDGREVRTAEVTHRQAVNLRAASRTRLSSLGSVTGTLASANTRRGLAGLWTDLDDRRVIVRLGSTLSAEIGKHLPSRVQVRGELSRNGAGQLLSVKAEEIVPLDAPVVRLTDTFGIAAGHLGDQSSVEYLDAAGGWS